MYESAKTKKVNLEYLDMVEEVFSLFPGIDFKKVSLIGAQHILPTTLLMINSFIKRGLNPERIHLIGKCYSTDIPTYEAMQGLGIGVCSSSVAFNQKESFDNFYAAKMETFFETAVKKLGDAEALLIIDDGGELLLKCNSIQSRLSCRLACIEQTTSGYEKLKKQQLHIPVVNVARSAPKLELESKIVAKSAVKAIAHKIVKEAMDPDRVLIIGNGAIGEAIANTLEGRCDVYCWDIDPKRSDIKSQEVCSSLHRFDLILGCTGTTSLQASDLIKLKSGAVVGSLSSSDREFDILEWRKLMPNCIACHSDFLTPNGVTVLNCGFPINFNGVVDQVDTPDFQLTRALIVGGVCQAISIENECGIIPMAKEVEEFISNVYLDKYSNRSDLLENL